MTIDDLLELHVVEYVISTEFVENRRDWREEEFLLAREAMTDALARGRPFVASDGFRALVVAVPGRPLMVPDHRTGELYVAKEQDFMSLLRSAW